MKARLCVKSCITLTDFNHTVTIIRFFCQSISSSLAALPVFSRWWPWRRGKTDLRGASRKLSRGQQDVPWLRRRESKNSRKLLYFVEWAQECKMSDSGFFFFLGLGRITCWRRRTLKITGYMCVCLRCYSGTRMFVVTHLHILLRQP